MFFFCFFFKKTHTPLTPGKNQLTFSSHWVSSSPAVISGDETSFFALFQHNAMTHIEIKDIGTWSLSVSLCSNIVQLTIHFARETCIKVITVSYSLASMPLSTAPCFSRIHEVQLEIRKTTERQTHQLAMAKQSIAIFLCVLSRANLGVNIIAVKEAFMQCWSLGGSVNNL